MINRVVNKKLQYMENELQTYFVIILADYASQKLAEVDIREVAQQNT